VAQGLSYSTVVTSLPAFKIRYGIGDDTVSLIMLTVVLGAASGSILSDVIARKWGSRAALVVGFSLQAAALAGVAIHAPFAVFWAFFGLYGIGLGMVDAAAAMQGFIVQRRLGLAIMGSFFAANTAAIIVGALVVSASASTTLGASLGLAAAAVVATAIAIVGPRIFDPTHEPPSHEVAKARLPRLGILLFGFVIFAAFTADSAIANWSTVYLHDTMHASATLAPLGYATYAAFTLISRLGSDFVVRRFGRAHLAVTTAAIAVVGVGLAGLWQSPYAALVGFALAGLGVGALVPLAFSAAGDLDHARSDQIIAKINLFNYGGSLVGAVIPGLLSKSVGLNSAFLIAAVMLLPMLLMGPRFRRSHSPDSARHAPMREPVS
jgi:MFS family permease